MNFLSIQNLRLGLDIGMIKIDQSYKLIVMFLAKKGLSSSRDRMLFPKKSHWKLFPRNTTADRISNVH